MSLDAFLDPPADLRPTSFADATTSSHGWSVVDATAVAASKPSQHLQLVMVAPNRRVPAELAAQCLAAFDVEWDGDAAGHRTLRSWRRIPLADAVRGKGAKRFLLRLGCGRGWDSLEPAAMRAILRDGCGEARSGVQVVQPGLILSDGGLGLPWHSAMPVHYAVATGRDLWHDLPLLFVDGPEDRLVRRLIHRVVNRTLGYSTTGSATAWQCVEAGAGTLQMPLLTGRNQLAAAMASFCGSRAALYRHQDEICVQVYGADEVPRLALMEAVSVARQLGRPATALLDLAPTELPALAPMLVELLAAGITRFLFGNRLSSGDGAAQLSTALGRCSALFTAGRPQVDVLILHPAEAVASEYRRSALRLNGAGQLRPVAPNPAGRHQATRLDKQLQRLVDGVRDAGCDADLGDEELIDSLGNALEAHYIIGEMRYPVVVLPEARSWRHKTVCFLEHFVKQGGRLLLAGDAPTEVDDIAAPERWADLLAGSGVQRLDPAPHAMRKGIAAACPLSPRIRRVRRIRRSRGDKGVAVATPQLRVRVLEDGRRLYLVANAGPVSSLASTLLALDGASAILSALEPVHGTCAPVTAEGLDGTGSLLFQSAPGSVIGFLEGEVATGNPQREISSFTLPGL